MKLLSPIRNAAGFTLIELVISGALMALILTAAYACLRAALSAQQLVEPRVDALQTGRVVLSLMAAELRAACPLSNDAEFVGMDRALGEVEADNLDFATHHYTPRRQGEADYCQISYYLEPDPKSGHINLWRRRNPTIALDPFAGGAREQLATGVGKLRFEYYDGFDWFDSWGDPDGRAKEQSSSLLQSNLSGMPEAVRITLWLVPDSRRIRSASSNTSSNEPPLVFHTVARLNLATTSTDASATGSSSSPSQTGSQSSQPGGAPPPGF